MATAQQIRQAYPGYTGWQDPELIADYNATGGQGKGNAAYAVGKTGVLQATQPSLVPSPIQTQATAQPVSPGGGGGSSALEQALISKGYNPTDARNAANGPRAAELAAEYGVGTGMGARAGFGLTQPTIDLNAIYESSYKSPEIQKLNEEITAKQKARDEAVAIVNDNPFYSEATRVGKIAKINEKYNDDATTLQNERAMKLADAEIKVNLAMKQYDISNEAYKNQLSVFNSLLSAGGLTNATGEDIASYAVATGIPTSLIQGIADKQKQEAIKPQVFDNTDDNGNVTLSIVDVNTGNIINTTSLGKVGGGSGGGGELGSKNLQKLKTDVSNWMNLTELAKKYVGVFSKDEVLSVYNTFHQNDDWGPPSDSSEQLNKIFGVSKAGGVESLTSGDKANVNQIKDDIKNKLYTREEAVQAYPEYAPYI